MSAGRSAGIGSQTCHGYRGDLLPQVRANFAALSIEPQARRVRFVRGLLQDTLPSEGGRLRAHRLRSPRLGAHLPRAHRATMSAGQAGVLLRNAAFGTGLLIVAVALLAPERAAIGVMLATLAARTTLMLAGWRKPGVHPLGAALLPLLAAGVASVLLARVLAPTIGVLAANAVGIAAVVFAALAVLARTRDLHFLHEDLARAPRS